MSTRAARLPALTAATLTALTIATMTPAAARFTTGGEVEGRGPVYLFSGAFNVDGQAQRGILFGEDDDLAYVGDWYGTGRDLPMVRRGNTFHVPGRVDPSVTATVFSYGDVQDDVHVGDWDGDGIDSLAVRRGNTYFVKNDVRTSGVADTVFTYGDPEDHVLVGNWNGEVRAPAPGVTGKGDTLMVVRDGHFFVKNDLRTGTADADFLFGNPDDAVYAGDWAPQTTVGGKPTATDADGADQLAVRRGNQYFLSAELPTSGGATNPRTTRVLTYGNPDDAVFVATSPTLVDANGDVTEDDTTATGVITGDGLGVRRLLS
ncbi:hypothetical protein GB931_11305 [Modestobacter sp. I12A-02628]|uniref:Uncharacterized protein n=1 Tax=Goekera deserti TaxID=2497753 RepID=A0A7K3WC83_9ACTN|nr:hypothetical protein [Goekera deserti]MPQ98493.1 hypothetical protein [Goekera deserti]NDI48323.1 hypothetical protein [Goekera deserti]NEL54072.1 hypothetical protein [Goekera deserti]